jgi:dTDP-4-dehydrorhamnose 3,5-epimerase
MIFSATPISGVWTAESEPHNDERGQFTRFFCSSTLAPILGPRKIAQVNFSRTLAVGTVRGLHYQNPPHAEMKFVRCVRGKIWDVAVDVRAGSASFLNWHAEELSPSNNKMMIISEGFAHGFQSLEADCEVLYLHTTTYVQTAEAGMRPTDPLLSVMWPLPLVNVSPRDKNRPLITQSFAGIVV